MLLRHCELWLLVQSLSIMPTNQPTLHHNTMPTATTREDVSKTHGFDTHGFKPIQTSSGVSNDCKGHMTPSAHCLKGNISSKIQQVETGETQEAGMWDGIDRDAEYDMVTIFLFLFLFCNKIYWNQMYCPPSVFSPWYWQSTTVVVHYDIWAQTLVQNHTGLICTCDRYSVRGGRYSVTCVTPWSLLNFFEGKLY